MRWPKIASNWQLSIGLMKSLTPIFLFGGVGLAVCCLIAISITSGILAITIIMLLNIKKVWLPLEPMLIALGVEIVLLVIAGVMMFIGSQWAWWGLRS
jgi:phage-related holin